MTITMSEEMKVNEKSGLSKKIIIVAAGVIVLALALVLAITAPKRAEAKRLADQLDLGEKYLSELDYEQAVIAYLKAIEINPKCEDAYLALADIYIATGELEKAEDILKKAEKGLGGVTEKVKEKIGKVDEAKQAAKVTPKPTPTNTPEPTPTDTPEPTHTKAERLAQQLDLGRKYLSELNYEQAAAAYLKAIEIDPKCEDAYLVLADIYIATVELEKTEEILKKAERELGGVTEKIREKIEEAEEAKREEEIIPESTLINTPIPMPMDTPVPTPTDTPILTPTNTPVSTMTTETDTNMFVYEDNEDGTLTITGFSEKGREAQLTVISIPKTVNGKQVTSIDYNAFRGCSGLTSIIIPEGVTSIGDSAFSGCSGLTSFEVATGNVNYASKDGVLYSKDGTVLCKFVVTVERKEFIVPEGVTSISRRAFAGCSELTSITLPEGVTFIGDWAFEDCSGLTSITIPESVTFIGDGAFFGCSGLTGITLPKSVTYIGESVFNRCSGLTSITWPESVTSVSWWAFYRCSGLTSITIPESIISIDGYAFYGCSELTSITIPEGVTSIGFEAFAGCSGLTITASSGSYAENYAIENNIPVETY